jgi:DNA topoisomerase I
MLIFGRALSQAREQVLLDLGSDGMTKERASAVAVRLLDLGYFRIGNEVYAEEHNSFGLTTLERRHVRRSGKAMVFQFTGKSGIEHSITIDDPGAVEALEVMRRRRGGDDSLLAWKDGRRWRSIDSSVVNEYVGRATGIEATAKDFRTWHATVIAAASLAEAGEQATKTARKRAVTNAMKEVAEYLGNTPALARSAYVDPRVVDAYEEGRTIVAATRRRYKTADARQSALERAVLRLLKE